MPSDAIIFTGIAHPKGRSKHYTKTDVTDHFNKDELDLLKLEDLPVCFEHGPEVGQVLASWNDPSRGLMVMGIVKGNSLDGMAVQEAMRQGKILELSLGHGYRKLSNRLLRDGSVETKWQKEPQELSVVMKGARDNCIIDRMEDVYAYDDLGRSSDSYGFVTASAAGGSSVVSRATSVSMLHRVQMAIVQATGSASRTTPIDVYLNPSLTGASRATLDNNRLVGLSNPPIGHPGVTTTTTRRPPNPVSTPPPAADARAERARSALEMIDGVSNGNRDPIALYQREKEESERLRDQLRKEKERNAAQLAETEKVKQLGAEKTNHQIDKFLDSLKQGGFGPEHVDFLRSRLAVTPETPIEQLNNDDMRYAELVTASNNFFATRTKEEVNAIKDRMEAERRALQLKVAEKEAMLEFAKGELQEIYGEGNGGGPMRGVDQRRLERRMDPLRKPGARFQTPAATNTAPPATQPATANALPGGTPAAGTTDPNAAAAATATPATANPFQEQLQNFNNLTPDQVRELGGQLWNRNFSSAAAAAPNAQPNAAPANNGMIPNTMIPAPVPEGYGGNWGNMPQHTAGFVSVNASAAHHAQQLNYPPGAVKAIGMGKRMTNIYNKYAGALGASVVDEIMTSFNPNSTIHTKRNPYHLKGFNGTSDRPVLESALMPARQFD